MIGISPEKKASPRLKIAHLFQGSDTNFHQPLAGNLHIYHTMRGLQKAGHQVALLGLQKERRVLFTQDLAVFKSHEPEKQRFGKLGITGWNLFQIFERAIRLIQHRIRFPYLAIFDSLRMADACLVNLKGYDIIHERFNLLAIGGAVASKLLRIPFVLEINADLLAQRRLKGIPEVGLREKYGRWTTRYCFNAAARIICISSDLKEHLVENWKIDENKLTVLPCAADTEAFGKTEDTQQVRKSLGLRDEPVVMWVGGFFRWHDLDLLISSFKKVCQSLPEAKLVLVGDGETRPKVEAVIRVEGLQEAVILTGAVPHSDVPKILSIADVVVSPSLPVTAGEGGTGAPLKLFEYMAAGKPIVATASRLTAEVIQNMEDGLLVEPGDEHAFAEAVVRLLCNDTIRQRIGQNARRKALAQHSWEQYTVKLEEIYRDLIKNGE